MCLPILGTMTKPDENHIRFNLMCLDGTKTSSHLYLDHIVWRAHAKGFPLEALEMATHCDGPIDFKVQDMTREMFNTFIDKYRASVNDGKWLEPEDGTFVLRTFL
jgi:hypothetical protein